MHPVEISGSATNTNGKPVSMSETQLRASALALTGDGADLLPSLADGSLIATVALLEDDGRDWRRVATRVA